MNNPNLRMTLAIGGCLSHAKIIAACLVGREASAILWQAKLLVESLKNTHAYSIELEAEDNTIGTLAYERGMEAAATLVEFAGHPVSAALIRAKMEAL